MDQSRHNKTFQSQYYWLLHDLLACEQEMNYRTNQAVRVHEGARFLSIDMANRLLPTCGVRKTHPRVAAAETAWQVMGTQSLTWLQKYTKIWDQFADVRECTDCHGEPLTPCQYCTAGKVWETPFAYGYRMVRAFGRDQLQRLCDTLGEDPSNRRTWVSLWDPSRDGLGATGQKNVPCPVGFSAWIQRGMLHMSVAIRSSDAFVGLPYDVMNFAMLMAILAAEIGLHQLGVLSFTLHNVHLYESHRDMAREAMDSDFVETVIPLSFKKLEEVRTFPRTFVDHYVFLADQTRWPTFNPRPEVHA